MKRLYRLIGLGLLFILACEPTTTEVGNWQNEAELQRKLLETAQVRTLDIINIAINGDTLLPRQHIAFNDYGERILSEEQGLANSITIKYTHTSNHQVSQEKHYKDQEIIGQVQYEYGASGKLISSIASSPKEEVKKLLTYDNNGNLHSEEEVALDKMAQNKLLYQKSTVYAYEMGLCVQQESTRTDEIGNIIEKVRYQYDYNARGRMTRRREYINEQFLSETHWEYTQNGQAKYIAYYEVDETGQKALSFQKKYRYNQDGLCLQITTGNAAGNILEQQFYEYQYLNSN